MLRKQLKNETAETQNLASNKYKGILVNEMVFKAN